MSDYIVRATAADGQIRAFAANTKDVVETARKDHNTSPVATAALGRLLTGGAMMGIMMKGDKDVLTLQIKCSGPIGGLTVTSDSKGRVKGYVNHPEVMLPANAQGKLDVGGALGLGVLMEKDNTVRQAGGFIVQLMPNAEEEVIEKLEKNLAQITSVTELLDQGYTPEMLLEKLLGDMDLEINEKVPTSFYCNCDKVRVGKVLISLGEKELQGMIDDGENIELNCHFCNTNYTFSVEELKELLELARK